MHPLDRFLRRLRGVPYVVSVASKWSRLPRERLITISKINSALCPFRYYKEYVEIPRCGPSFISIDNGLGDYFHSFLENHFKSIQARNRAISQNDTVDVEELVNKFELTYFDKGELIKPYRIVRDRDPKEFFERLQTIGDNFNIFLQNNLIGHEIIEEGIERELEMETDSFVIRGRFDLITRNAEGEMVLWDWKTGRAPDPSKFDSNINDRYLKKIQLGIYAIWMRYMFNLDDVCATSVFLRDRFKISTISELFDLTMERKVLVYLKKERAKLNTLSSYYPNPNNLCDWCGWKPVCPAFR